MNTAPRRWTLRSLGFLLLAVLVACTVTGDGYVQGVYEEPGYEYGGWGPAYHVGPPRGGEHRDEHRDERRDVHGGGGGGEHRSEPSQPAPPRTYRPPAPSRPAPSIPSRPAPPSRHDRGHK